MSSQYLISTRWMSRQVLLRSLGVLVAVGAAEVLPVSLNCSLPLRRTHPPSTLVCRFCVFATLGVTSTKSGRLEVNLSLSEKPGGKIGGRCMSTSAWCPLENAFVCLRAHARTYSGAAKTHTAEQHGSPQYGSRGSSHNQGPAVACDLLLAS